MNTLIIDSALGIKMPPQQVFWLGEPLPPKDPTSMLTVLGASCRLLDEKEQEHEVVLDFSIVKVLLYTRKDRTQLAEFQASIVELSKHSESSELLDLGFRVESPVTISMP